jgi:heme/copper-type cytochrome/quinol oxidase subunit 3
MNETSSESTHLVAPRDNNKLAVWIFLSGEVILFTTLILSYVVLRLHQPAGYTTFKEHLSVPLIGVNTFILISSSYLVVRAFEAIQAGKVKSLRNNLIGVMILGAMFLTGQAIEWTALFGAGVSIDNEFGTPFFTITGIHGTHVFIGLIWATFILISAVRGAYSAKNYQGVEVFGLYWHFVDIVWVVLFTLFYLI